MEFDLHWLDSNEAMGFCMDIWNVGDEPVQTEEVL